MFQEILPYLDEIREQKDKSKGRAKSFYLFLSLSDLKDIRNKGYETILPKLSFASGQVVTEKNDNEKHTYFKTTNIELEKLFHQFEDKTIVKDLNKSWDSSKKWFYRSLFYILDFRKDQIKKLLTDIRNQDGVLNNKNNIHEDYIEKRKSQFLMNFKNKLDEGEVLKQFNIKPESYYSEKRTEFLSTLSEIYFDQLFLNEIDKLMAYIKGNYNRPDLVIYINAAEGNRSNEDLYEFEHSIFVMFTGFLKASQLKVKLEGNQSIIYGFVPLLSFANDNKKTFRNYGRKGRTNFLVSASMMMRMYQSGLFDQYVFSREFKEDQIAGILIKKKIIFTNEETLLAEQIIRNDISDKLPVPELPFEVIGEVNFQNKVSLFKEIRSVLFNNPRGFYSNFYYRGLDAEVIQNMKIEPGKVTNSIKEAAISTHPIFKSFFDGNPNALKVLFKNKLLRLFEERVLKTNNDVEWKQRDIKNLINMIAYIKQISFGQDEVINLEEMRKNLKEVTVGERNTINNKEFFYAIGQLGKFYANKSKKKEKRFTLYDGLEESKNVKRLLNELLKLKQTYHHEIRINDKKHNNLLNAVLNRYDQLDGLKMGLDEKIYFNAGLVDESIFYELKKESDELEGAG